MATAITYKQIKPADVCKYDGVSLGEVMMRGNVVMKGSARKVRKLFHGKVLAGFAGATADAFTLFERFEAKLEKHQGHLVRAAIELTRDWRTDKVLRNLEAMLAVADREASLIITGNGDVLEPEGGIAAIGSGGNFALAAARGLMQTDLPAEDIARKAMAIAARDDNEKLAARIAELEAALKRG